MKKKFMIQIRYITSYHTFIKNIFGRLIWPEVILLLILIAAGCSRNNSFQLVLLPDTQVYSERFPEIFKAQTAWIAENADSITFVLHQGDITNRNTEEQWQNAIEAIKILDNKVPFTFVGGNHDMGDSGRANTRDTELLNRYLPYEKYSKMEGFGGAFEHGKMDNTWHTFKAGGLKWLILSLEFGPRNKVLDWAAEIIEKHPSHKIIINTHAYMYSDDTNISAERGHSWIPQRYGVGKLTGTDSANDGEMMWQKLVSQFPNILMVVSGHVLNDGTGKLISTGKHGNKVYQVLANYQMNTNGGNGFLRILKIDTKLQKISVKTYSPYVEQFNTDSDHHFEFENVVF
jgi:predicted phosphodiesterase